MKTQKLKTKALFDLRKLIQQKLIQETGQNPFSEIIKDLNDLPQEPKNSNYTTGSTKNG